MNRQLVILEVMGFEEGLWALVTLVLLNLSLDVFLMGELMTAELFIGFVTFPTFVTVIVVGVCVGSLHMGRKVSHLKEGGWALITLEWSHFQMDSLYMSIQRVFGDKDHFTIFTRIPIISVFSLTMDHTQVNIETMSGRAYLRTLRTLYALS